MSKWKTSLKYNLNFSGTYTQFPYAYELFIRH